MIQIVFKLLFFFGTPITFLSLIWLKLLRKKEIRGISENLFMYLGVLPVLDHYYQPLINPKKHLTKSLRDDRDLRGIDLNVEEQLNLLEKFNYNDELLTFPLNNQGNDFYYDNGSYCSGDAEYLYNMVRYFKPKRVLEVGCGNSTLMIRNAINKNRFDDSNYACHHICIEPYGQDWIEDMKIELIREKVENIDKSLFKMLESNDILFIDSSHIIRPQGDVLFECLEVLPILKSGVLIHIHDIFTPKDYLNDWVLKQHMLWNEQYLLEAFLSFNSEFRIIGSLNFLAHNYFKQFSEKCPVFAKQIGREPGAFWMIKK